MIIFKEPASLATFLNEKRRLQKSLGFVPTMGALHAGHLLLINESRAGNDLVVASIFVNPTQFNDAKDFQKYPKTIEKDVYALEKAGCDVLLLPDVEGMYPDGTGNGQVYDLGSLETKLEGFYRPGHFQGVCRVVHRLLDIVQPDRIYLGQKDFQQCMVIKRLISIIGSEAKVVVCPTLREADGLAMSSRNMRLNPDQRLTATGIYEALDEVRQNQHTKQVQELEASAVSSLTARGFRVDYVKIVDASNLEPVAQISSGKKMVALAAAYLDDIRLIDNIFLN